MPLTEATFDWLVTLDLADTLELLLWIGLLLRAKILGFQICFRDFITYLNRLTVPAGAPPRSLFRQVRRRLNPNPPPPGAAFESSSKKQLLRAHLVVISFTGSFCSTWIFIGGGTNVKMCSLCFEGSHVKPASVS